MRNITLAAVVAAAAAVGLADTAKAQVIVSVGGVGAGPVFPGGGQVYTSAYGYGFSPSYSYSYAPYGGGPLGRTYGLYPYPGATYGTTYYPATFYPSGYYTSGYYGGYRRGWRRW